jgi:hypothetical protein
MAGQGSKHPPRIQAINSPTLPAFLLLLPPSVLLLSSPPLTSSLPSPLDSSCSKAYGHDSTDLGLNHGELYGSGPGAQLAAAVLGLLDFEVRCIGCVCWVLCCVCCMLWLCAVWSMCGCVLCGVCVVCVYFG